MKIWQSACRFATRCAMGSRRSRVLKDAARRRAPGFWCCSIQGRKARDFYDTLKTETHHMYVISRHVYIFSYFLVYIYMSYMLIYLLIYILRSCIQLMSECVWCRACTQLALDCHLHRNDQSGATLIL